MRKRQVGSRSPVTFPDRVADVWVNLSSLYRKISTCPTDANGCINWIHAKHRQGYGMVGAWRDSTNKKIMTTVHRLLMKIKHNSDLNQLDVYHSCGNMRCVNEQHLLVGTTSDVITDLMRRRPNATRNRLTGGRRHSPRDQKYRYDIQDIIDAYHGRISREQWAKKYKLGVIRSGKIIWSIRTGAVYYWAKFYK